MANKSKAKGTWAESAIVAYAAGHGFPWALRPALQGSQDKGDVWLVPGPAVIVESKNVSGGASIGAPPPAQFEAWWTQTLVEQAHARADLAILVCKRAGTTDPGRWFAYAPGWLLLAAHHAGQGAPARWSPLLDEPVCMPLSHALTLIRAAGYGEPLSPTLLDHVEHVQGSGRL